MPLTKKEQTCPTYQFFLYELAIQEGDKYKADDARKKLKSFGYYVTHKNELEVAFDDLAIAARKLQDLQRIAKATNDKHKSNRSNRDKGKIPSNL